MSITFISNSLVLDVEETKNSKKLSGVFLKLDSVTGNGRRYSSAEGEQIAESLKGQPVFYEANRVIDPVTSMIQVVHRKGLKYKVGYVVKSIYDKFNNVIHGVVEVFNTKFYPNILERISTGWGFSIGGAVKYFEESLNNMGEMILNAIGMVANHLQLLEPTTPRGQGAAQVTGIEEVINFMSPEGLIVTFEGELLEDDDLVGTYRFGG